MTARFAGAAALVGCLASCALSCRVKSEVHASLAGSAIARVGSAVVVADVVEAIARNRGISPADALNALIEDALLAQEATRLDLATTRETQRAARAARARWVAEKIAADARAEGPVNDAELAELSAIHWREVDLPEQVRVIHAVVLLPSRADPAAEARGPAVAARLRAAVASATDADDFERRARAVPADGLKVTVERLPPFVADGRVSEAGDGGGFDATFAAAAFALHGPGQTTDVVRTPYGWHVIRLIERLPEHRIPREDRRALFRDEALTHRGRQRYEDALAHQKREAPVTIASDAEQNLQEILSAPQLARTQ